MSNVITTALFSYEYESFARRKWIELHQLVLSSVQQHHEQRLRNITRDKQRDSEEGPRQEKSRLSSLSPDDLLHVMLYSSQICAPLQPAQVSSSKTHPSQSQSPSPSSVSEQAVCATGINEPILGEAHHFWSMFPSCVSRTLGDEVRVTIGDGYESSCIASSSDNVPNLPLTCSLFDSPLHLLLPSKHVDTTCRSSFFTVAMDRACSNPFTVPCDDSKNSAEQEEMNFIRSMMTTVLGYGDEQNATSVTTKSSLTSFSLPKLPSVCFSKRMIFYGAVLGLLSKTDESGLAVESARYINKEDNVFQSIDYRGQNTWNHINGCTSLSIGRCVPIPGLSSEKSDKGTIKVKRRWNNGINESLYKYEDDIYGAVPQRICNSLIPDICSCRLLDSAAFVTEDAVLECVREVVGNNDKYFVFEEECGLIVVSMFEDSAISSYPFPLSTLSQLVTSLTPIELPKYENSALSSYPITSVFLSSLGALVGPILYACGASLTKNIRSYPCRSEGDLTIRFVDRPTSGFVGTRPVVATVYPIQLMPAYADSSVLLYPLDYHICNSQYINEGNNSARHNGGGDLIRKSQEHNITYHHFVKEAYLLNRALYLCLWRPLQHPTIELLSTCILFERLLMRHCTSKSSKMRSSSITVIHYCFTALKTPPLLVVFPWLVTAFGGSALPPREVLQLWDWVMVLHLRHQQAITKMNCTQRVDNVYSGVVLSPIYSLLAVAAVALFELRMDLICHVPEGTIEDTHEKGKDRAIVTSRKELMALYRTDMSSILLVPLIERYIRENI